MLRTIVPLALVWLLVASAWIPGPLYRGCLWLQVLFYLAGVLAPWAGRFGWGRALAVPFYFLSANAAAVVGLVQFLTGRHSAVWIRPEV